MIAALCQGKSGGKSGGSSLPEIHGPKCGGTNSADPKTMNKAILAQHRNQTVELIPDGADPRLPNSLITLNYHDLLPVVAPTDLSLKDLRTPFFIIHANGQKFKQAWISHGKLKWKI